MIGTSLADSESAMHGVVDDVPKSMSEWSLMRCRVARLNTATGGDGS